MLLIERATGVGRADQADSAEIGRPVIGQVRTIALVLFAWILFRSPDLPYAVGYMQALLRPGGGLPVDVALALDPLAAIALLVGVASVLLPRDWVTGVRLERNATPRTRVLRLAAVGAVFPAAVVFLVAAGFSPFLYFRF
jgi:hypothetical protein